MIGHFLSPWLPPPPSLPEACLIASIPTSTIRECALSSRGSFTCDIHEQD